VTTHRDLIGTTRGIEHGHEKPSHPFTSHVTGFCLTHRHRSDDCMKQQHRSDDWRKHRHAEDARNTTLDNHAPPRSNLAIRTTAREATPRISMKTHLRDSLRTHLHGNYLTWFIFEGIYHIFMTLNIRYAQCHDDLGGGQHGDRL
jgi:hypothetical protein